MTARLRCVWGATHASADPPRVVLRLSVVVVEAEAGAGRRRRGGGRAQAPAYSRNPLELKAQEIVKIR